MRALAIFMLIGLLLSVVSCGPLKLPKLPERVISPETAVVAVDLVDQSEEAARYDVHVVLNNRNDFPLPLNHATYRMRLGGSQYSSDVIPNATVPALGEITITLPAVFATVGGAAPLSEGSYFTAGSVTMSPGGQIRQLMYEFGFPKPRATFDGTGQVSRATR